MFTKKMFLGGFAFLLLFSGCGQDTEAPVEEAKKVQAQTVTLQNFGPHLEVFGALEPRAEANLNAEISGTIATVFVYEGQSVLAGQALATFESGDSLVRLAYENALRNFENAKTSLELTKSVAARQEDNARIVTEQAEIALRNAEVSDEKTGISLESQIAAAQRSVDIVKTNTEIAQKALDNLTANSAKTTLDLQQTAKNSLDSIILTIRDGLDFVDETIQITDKNKSRPSYGTALSFFNSNLLVRVTNDWKTLNTKTLGIEKKESEIGTADSKSLEEYKDLLRESEELAGEVQDILKDFQEVLANSLTGNTISESTLASLKTTTNTLQSTLATQRGVLISSTQNISDFVLRAPQNIQNAELSFLAAQNQLAQSEQNLRQLEAATDVQRVGTAAQRETAAKTLESAQNTLANVREQNSLQIQNTQNQYDQAKNQLDQAEVQLSRMTIISPLDGVVLRKSIDTGDTVSIGAPLFVVADTSTLVLRADIDPAALKSIPQGQKVQLTLDGDKDLEGEITHLSAAADPATRRLGIEISVENANNGVSANVFATAEIPVDQDAPTSIVLPLKSLISQNPAKIFVIEEETTSNDQPEFPEVQERILRVKERIVILGRISEDSVEVLEGLFPGEQFVAERVIGLKEGDPVELLPEPEKTPEDKQNTSTESHDTEKNMDTETEPAPPENGTENSAAQLS